MKTICITGTIGAGKSTVSYLLRRKRYPVFDADGYSRICLQDNHPAAKEITNLFGETILDDFGAIDRKKVAQLVFQDEEKRQALNAIVHPYVKKGMFAFFAKHKDASLVFAEVPLVFEAGWEDCFDAIVVVTCDKDIAIQRLMEDRNYTNEEANARYAAQLSPSQQIAKADFVIENNGTMVDLEATVTEWIRKVK